MSVGKFRVLYGAALGEHITVGYWVSKIYEVRIVERVIRTDF